MNVFGLAVDTFQQCFLLCEEEKDQIQGWKGSVQSKNGIVIHRPGFFFILWG